MIKPLTPYPTIPGNNIPLYKLDDFVRINPLTPYPTIPSTNIPSYTLLDFESKGMFTSKFVKLFIHYNPSRYEVALQKETLFNKIEESKFFDSFEDALKYYKHLTRR